MLFVTNLTSTVLLYKTVKRMPYLGYILLRYVLIYILEVPFNFHFNFRAANVIGSKHPLGVDDACDTVFFLK